MIELTLQERSIILWLLEDVVRGTLLLVPEGKLEDGRIPVMCSECGGQAYIRGEIVHTPGCDVAPAWALFDKLTREWDEPEQLEEHPVSPPSD